MLLPSTMTLQNWDESLQSFLTDQASEQNADDGAGVNRAECRPPLPSSIAPGAAVITAPHRRRHKWFRDKKRWLFKAALENSEQSTGVVWGNPPTFTHIVTLKKSTYTSDGYLHLHAKKDSIFLSRIYIHLCMPAKLFVRIKVVQCVPWCSTILRFSEFLFDKLCFYFQ